MATKSEAPAIAVAPLAVAFLFSSFFVSQKKNSRQLMLAEKESSPSTVKFLEWLNMRSHFATVPHFPPPPLINSQFSTVPLYALLDATGPSPLPLKTMCSPLPPKKNPPTPLTGDK